VVTSLLLPDSARDVATGLAGHLVSPGRGLLIYFPLAWLAIPGFGRLARRRPAPAALFGGLLALFLAVFATFRIWWGVVSWGPRFVAPLLPLVAVAAAVGAAESPAPRRARAAFAALAVLGLLVSWNAVLTDPNDYAAWLLAKRGISLDAGPVQFDPGASPLVSGWPMQTGLPIDIFWLRLWHPDGVGVLPEPLPVLPAN